ncbi:MULTISPECIES: phenylalanine--tRNA ligase subunit alpha [unclassified Pseudomonas]|uniref:phenylalanine--tRNA ligase subunit alpha n=1 Tax=unclassified Pseudomonas TaxID=196821 RepID=UPI0002A27BF4|nr:MULTISPECIES: phenylalanine--tRNA ligase subunit alpha [unclassified Pseudomonas]MBB1608692.1 phenylalanine--tRNA ligase subunit alpha [Pseudomonas sp. UMC76]MBB1637000.1 phenylalanine--tRNA ligase subunit alpha [Pseudomonas sp. UME83]NTX88797.1 phenylalanine--tRNA ligase subunit alpha [Pseudomonas sp. UMA643]NTY17344.1 phenylalanine--tRNA ligase subunit alpha [Pseudomonas sp. UMC3103]NTY24842.1 phenylalanine--tRNA ligase subunit alpha [Pseudomonas sp. UMA603]
MIENILAEIHKASTIEELNTLRVKYLGKSGLITRELSRLKELPEAERASVAAGLNELKRNCLGAIEIQKDNLATAARLQALNDQSVDVTLPGAALSCGGLHPLTRTIGRLLDIFQSLGYEVIAGPELESDHYNFKSLNFPDDHPARDTQDTFWTHDGRLLRTHTSSVQVRYMETHAPPFRVVSPGKVFRNEAVDQTHEAQFHQLEALVVGEGISMSDLRGAINAVATALFGDSAKTRLQPSYFPFVEPGAEFSVWWHNPRSGQQEWLELGGCGMVHPNVLEGVGYRNVSGFAFGLGIERLAMIAYGIPDIRYFHQNDTRFLRQVRGTAV